MNLDLKKTLEEILKLKYFWIYAVIYALMTTISTFFNTLENLHFHSAISNVFSILTFISVAYIIVMINNLIHEKELNDDSENFWQNLWKSTKLGAKAFIGVFANIMIFFVFTLVLALLWLVPVAMLDTSNTFIKSPISIAVFILLILFSVFAMLFIVNLLLVSFAENYALKDMFRWIKVAKTFFKKGFAKKTFAVIGSYLLICVLLSAILLGSLFLFNLGIAFFAKTLLQNHYLTVAILVSLSGLILPFVGGFAHFMVSTYIYNLLAKIYKESSKE